MAVPYNWRCKICEQANLAHAPACVHCGFRAVAAPIEVHAEIAERTGVPLSKVEQDEYDFFESTQGMPWWKKCIVHTLQLILILCAIVVKMTLFSINSIIALIVMAAGAIALYSLSEDKAVEHRATETPPEKP